MLLAEQGMLRVSPGESFPQQPYAFYVSPFGSPVKQTNLGRQRDNRKTAVEPHVTEVRELHHGCARRGTSPSLLLLHSPLPSPLAMRPRAQCSLSLPSVSARNEPFEQPDAGVVTAVETHGRGER